MADEIHESGVDRVGVGARPAISVGQRLVVKQREEGWTYSGSRSFDQKKRVRT
jgi:hypothetical protein